MLALSYMHAHLLEFTTIRTQFGHTKMQQMTFDVVANLRQTNTAPIIVRYFVVMMESL